MNAQLSPPGEKEESEAAEAKHGQETTAEPSKAAHASIRGEASSRFEGIGKLLLITLQVGVAGRLRGRHGRSRREERRSPVPKQRRPDLHRRDRYRRLRHDFWGWGTALFDYDNDAKLDWVATNGWPSHPAGPAPMRLWRNDGASFFERAIAAGLSTSLEGRGLLVFDPDEDGDLDVFVVHSGAQPILYRSDGGNHRAVGFRREATGRARQPSHCPPAQEGLGSRRRASARL
jgi:hypothetical protein